MCKATARVASSGAQKAVCHLFIFSNIVFVPFQCICNVSYFVPVNFLFTCVSIVQHNILEKGRMLWHSLESQTSINSNISSSDKFHHHSLLFCYLLSYFQSEKTMTEQMFKENRPISLL